MAINFFEEDLKFNLTEKIKIKKWLKNIAGEEGFVVKNLNYIFCSDEYLHRMNVNYLQHNTYTDIITFDTSEKENILEGDIFISIERVKENACVQNQEFNQELFRVLCHGLFHLCGIKDKLPEDAIIMRLKEDQAILKLTTIN